VVRGDGWALRIESSRSDEMPISASFVSRVAHMRLVLSGLMMMMMVVVVTMTIAVGNRHREQSCYESGHAKSG
jgi:hypothetical protein